ncbi:hypothetical protein [Lacrimispora sp.]|uniref:hypothetical protein n=1 Tax=Lacrimispora sp. TaxID=2719234 RepID=UPI00399220CA
MDIRSHNNYSGCHEQVIAVSFCLFLAAKSVRPAGTICRKRQERKRKRNDTDE